MHWCHLDPQLQLIFTKLYPENKKYMITINAMINCFIDNNQNEKAISMYQEYNNKHDNVSNLLLITAYTNYWCNDKMFYR